VRALAQIEHPNVVKALEVGVDGETHFFSMSFVPGCDLKRRLAAGEQFAEAEALRIALGVAEALKHTWERHRLLHRDIKPANIIVTPEGEVKLMDLGISKYATKRDASLTLAGMMVGSPLYISPEQARAEPDLDFRADMYSLGATLYHLLTGQPPYDHENAVAIIACHLSDPVPDPRQRRPDLSEATGSICRRMLQKRKGERFGSWDELIRELESALAALSEPAPKLEAELPEPVAPVTPSLPLPVPPRAGAQLRWARVAALLAVLGASVFCLHRVIRKSLHEQAVRELTQNYAAATTAMKAFVQQPSREAFSQAYVALTGIKRRADELGERDLIRQAETDLQAIKEQYMAMLAERRRRLCQAELDRLKIESEALAQRGNFAAARQVWQDYRGEFRADLAEEIRRQLADLAERQRRHEAGLD